MQTGQRLRLKVTSRLAQEWGLPPGAEGVLLCQYRAPAPHNPERLDVRFDSRRVLWGAPAGEFEALGDVAKKTDAPKKTAGQ